MTGIASIAFHQEEHSKADVTRARECGERPKVCGGVALFWVELWECLKNCLCFAVWKVKIARGAAPNTLAHGPGQAQAVTNL